MDLGVDNSTPQELLEFWKKGKSLNDAAWKYTDRKIWNTYCDARSKLNSATTELSDPQNFVSRLSEIVVVSQKNKEYAAQFEQANKDLWENLYEKLGRDQLIGIGYELPIKSKYPVLIPAYMWPPHNIDSENESISAHEFNYVRVRIIKEGNLQPLQKKKIKLPQFAKDSPKIGRPTLVGDKIIEAYKLLEADGQIDVTKPLTAHYAAIRKTVRIRHKEYLNDDGMCDEAIRKRVAHLFNDKRASHKVSHKQ